MTNYEKKFKALVPKSEDAKTDKSDIILMLGTNSSDDEWKEEYEQYIKDFPDAVVQEKPEKKKITIKKKPAKKEETTVKKKVTVTKKTTSPKPKTKDAEGYKLSGFNLIHAPWSDGNGVDGTIRTTPQNYFVATITKDGNIEVKKEKIENDWSGVMDANVRTIDIPALKKAWKDGKIPMLKKDKFKHKDFIEVRGKGWARRLYHSGKKIAKNFDYNNLIKDIKRPYLEFTKDDYNKLIKFTEKPFKTNWLTDMDGNLYSFGNYDGDKWGLMPHKNNKVAPNEIKPKEAKKETVKKVSKEEQQKIEKDLKAIYDKYKGDEEIKNMVLAFAGGGKEHQIKDKPKQKTKEQKEKEAPKRYGVKMIEEHDKLITNRAKKVTNPAIIVLSKSKSSEKSNADIINIGKSIGNSIAVLSADIDDHLLLKNKEEATLIDKGFKLLVLASISHENLLNKFKHRPHALKSLNDLGYVKVKVENNEIVDVAIDPRVADKIKKIRQGIIDLNKAIEYAKGGKIKSSPNLQEINKLVKQMNDIVDANEEKLPHKEVEYANDLYDHVMVSLGNTPDGDKQQNYFDNNDFIPIEEIEGELRLRIEKLKTALKQ